MSVLVVITFQFVCGPPLPPGRKQIGRQVDSTLFGCSLFGCAAVGGRGIQHKKEYLLARTTFEDICEKLGKTTICQWFFCPTTIRKKSFFLLFSYLKEERECEWSRLFRMYDSPKAIFV